ncbi:MAG TPA: c-type cytochrome [Blastocatellia bacterium]|nr:c-type cytochrome [Blastocatellia bacterium]
MKRTIKIVVITIFALFLIEVIAGEIFLRTHRFSAREKPSWLEKTMAMHARRVSTPSDAMSLKNPNAITEESMAEAREHFVEHCSVCHGIDGKGQTTIGQRMYPPVPDMTQGETQQKADGELFYIISNGVRLTGMPAWEGEDTPESIWDLVAFIRHLPQLTPEELDCMKEVAGQAGEETGGGNNHSGEEKGDHKNDEKKSVGNENHAKPDAAKPKMKPHTHGPGAKPHEHPQP